MIKVSPTLACADYLHLANDIDVLESAGVSAFHLDIMDGNFVPNYCLNWDIIKQIREYSSFPLDVHLMVENLDRDIESAIDNGCDCISFHIEKEGDTLERISKIHKFNRKAGIVINPETPVSEIEFLLDKIDYVLVMSVKPGFSGQKFIESVLDKIEKLSSIKKDRNLSFEIEVDGGISFENAGEVVKRGADNVVAGALCIFKEKGNLDNLTREFIELVNREQ